MPTITNFLKGISFENVKGTLFNFGFRVGGIFAKFLLVVYISKEMSLEALGLYNIVAVTVAWSVYVIGFEFYAYSLRQIVGESPDVVAGHVFNQLAFHFTGFSFLLLLSPLLVILDFVPLEVLHYFILITIFDQMSQECFRILIALERSQFANFIYLLKSGLWVYPLLLLPTVFGWDINIHLILGSWVAGTVLSFFFGLWKLWTLRILRFRSVTLNIAWIRQGIVVAFPFLIISIAQQAMDFSDRYLIDYFLGKTEVGVYSFYYGIASVPTTLITSVLVAQYYPRVINVFKFDRPEAEKRDVIKRFLWQCIGLAIITSGAAVVLINPLLNFINRKELLDQISLFYLMLLQVIMFAVQVVVQTILYAKHFDRALLYSALAGAIINIGLNIWLIPVLGLYGATLSTIVAMLLILTIRTIVYYTQKKIIHERI
ncbi:oligosaccharide flippase family protein [Dawidia soli]|uniref:Polysaccharide biosynthesis C-terminal domain-containing protein n=1 Tax=Dawidia soli TaxID=2782352 RepID=A0AAP2DEB6_9BACT|nr:polysaccharide biosynthesis C-terminal domain-containing protein [Dawidia soli]MBT1690193.1 polysaccharide biosynthesis C-terminal domain-containing protein [Dawidia soli]